MGLKLLQYSVSFPSLGITEIIASFHEGGSRPSLRVQLKDAVRRGVSSSLKARYHSDGKPSLPGVLSLDMALDISSGMIGAVRLLFCISPIVGKSRELRNCLFASSLDEGGCVYNFL